jgi:hypothetical protein
MYEDGVYRVGLENKDPAVEMLMEIVADKASQALLFPLINSFPV